MGTLNQTLQEQLFSSSRLSGYMDLQEHEDNLALIASIAHKIGILEIILRNKIDSILSQDNVKWLESLPQDIKIDLSQIHLGKDRVISSQSLGFWIKVVEHHKIHNQIFDAQVLNDLDFRDYFRKNKNKFNRVSVFKELS